MSKPSGGGGRGGRGGGAGSTQALVDALTRNGFNAGDYNIPSDSVRVGAGGRTTFVLTTDMAQSTRVYNTIRGRGWEAFPNRSGISGLAEFQVTMP